VEKSTKIFIICETFGVLLLAFAILYPSYWSYSNGTNDAKFKESLEKGKIAGFYDPKTDIITLYVNSSRVLRHELCHKEQFHRVNYSYSVWSEVECNIKEFFIWKRVNLTTLDWEKR